MEPLDTQATKNVTSPDDLDMSLMKVSVTVTESDRFERSRDALTGLCHRTERVEVPGERMQASSDATGHDADQSSSGVHHAIHDLPQSALPVAPRQLAGDCTQVPAPWTSSSHTLPPSCSDPALLNYDLGGGHLSLARKLSDDAGLSDDEPPQRRMLSHGISLGSSQQPQHNHSLLQRDQSLSGAEDLRLSSTNSATRQQQRKRQQQPQADWFNEANNAEKWFVSNSARSSPQPETQMATTDDAGFGRRRSCGKVNQYDLLHQFRTDHSPLNRNCSAPVAKATTLLFPRSGGATMQRQSSTSDPLLHPKDDGSCLINATEAPPGGYVAAPPPVSCSFSAEKYQHWSPVYHRPAPASAPNVTSLGANRQIKVAFTPLGQPQAFPTAQRFVDPQSHASLLRGGPATDPYISFMPSHMMSQRQQDVMMQYGNVPPRDSVNAHQHMIPNLSQPPPSYQVVPPVATVSDKRHNLYFHLCGLFPEERVTQVMLQHPTETNPQILCAYLIRITNN